MAHCGILPFSAFSVSGKVLARILLACLVVIDNDKLCA